MNRAALIVLVSLLLVLPVASRPVTADTSPEDIVKQFYGWYVGRLVKDDFNPLKNRAVSLKYLTPQFLRRVPGLIKKTDADPIICAQDFDPGWAQNIKVEAATIKASQATTNVALEGQQQGMNVKLKITLKRTAAGWRIDNVDCGY